MYQLLSHLAHPSLSFTVMFPFVDLYSLKDMFKEEMDAPGGFGNGRRILVYGVLYNLFLEFACYPVVSKPYVSLSPPTPLSSVANTMLGQ